VDGGRASQAAAKLVATKLYAPAVRQKRVARPKLIERLRADSLPQLTLVDAPAGSGKTTLLADWHSTYEVDSAFAWLALDRGDDDPVRFWTYVVEALRTVAPGVGTRALALLRAPGAGLVELALTTLVNELRDVAGPLILVLDD
jgi:LuxR family transcriptional regulator, maltose regulon positive regulatory protein